MPVISWCPILDKYWTNLENSAKFGVCRKIQSVSSIDILLCNIKSSTQQMKLLEQNKNNWEATQQWHQSRQLYSGLQYDVTHKKSLFTELCRCNMFCMGIFYEGVHPKMGKKLFLPIPRSYFLHQKRSQSGLVAELVFVCVFFLNVIFNW